MIKSNKLAVLAALLSLLMLMSMLMIPAFAEETSTAESQTEQATESATDGATDAATGEGETTAAATTGSSTTAASTTGSATTSNPDEAAKKEQLTRGLINLGVGVVILIALAVLCIKFRDKIPAWFKGLKSECGKITWCSKDKLKKNTIVVVIIILAIAAVIAVLDFTFSSGIALLGGLGK